MKDVDLGKLRIDRTATATVALPARRGPRLRRWHGAVIAAVLVVGYWLLPSTVEVQTTRVVSAWPSQQYELLSATGYVVARRRTAVSFKGSGRIAWLGVSEGDHVKAGAVLARLEGRDVAATYRAAVANAAVAAAALPSADNEIEDAQRNLDRANVLFSRQLVALSHVQDAQSRLARAMANRASVSASLDAAHANQEVARSNYDYTTITAPFDGVVISLAANVGDVVTPVSSAAGGNAGVMTLADMGSLAVDADVSEASLSSIRPGQPCEILLDAFSDRRFRGQVSVIVPTVHRASATVTTKVRILDPDPRILPDMSARVSFLSKAVDARQQRPVMAVSPEAISGDGTNHAVYVIGSDRRVRIARVRLGALLGSVQEISGALEVGDTLVLNPRRSLEDGTAVRPVSAS